MSLSFLQGRSISNIAMTKVVCLKSYSAVSCLVISLLGLLGSLDRTLTYFLQKLPHRDVTHLTIPHWFKDALRTPSLSQSPRSLDQCVGSTVQG